MNILYAFQYHKGAIISSHDRMALEVLASISIPQRCDYFADAVPEAELSAWISIPQRCDYFFFVAPDVGANHEHFNTTKVRLFPSGAAARTGLARYFNTTKVRLFPRSPSGLPRGARAFQYHKGAIISLPSFPTRTCSIVISIPQRCDYFAARCRRPAAQTAISIPQRCDYFQTNSGWTFGWRSYFNTTKVRLFRISRRIRRLMRFNFNTTKVRLFHMTRVIRLFRPYHFNTTKVRLFPPRGRLPAARGPQFQYHKGAIISQRLKEQNQLFLGNFKRFSGTCQDHNVVDLQFTLKPRLIDDLI